MDDAPGDRGVVSQAVPQLHALSRTARSYSRLSQGDWRRLCALSLSATYSVLLLLASLCIATGIFHAAVHQHHTDAAAHQHAASHTHHASPVPDICDIVHQVCTALVLWAILGPTLALPQSPVAVQTVRGRVDATPSSPFNSRAPPALIS